MSTGISYVVLGALGQRTLTAVTSLFTIRSKNIQQQFSELSTTKKNAMEKVSHIRFGALPADSPYVKPIRFYYQQNGVEKNWDLLKVHDSVAIIIHNITRNVLVAVKQFRPAVYYSSIPDIDKNCDIDYSAYPPTLGITLELCAGIVDKDKSWEEIAREEVLEECGYNVKPENMEKVATCRSGVGSTGALMAIYYCTVSDEDRVTQGGGVDEELIEVVELTELKIREILSSGDIVNSPGGFLFGLQWFLSNKFKKDL